MVEKTKISMCQLQSNGRGGLEYNVEEDTESREKDVCDQLVMASVVKKEIVWYMDTKKRGR